MRPGPGPKLASICPLAASRSAIAPATIFPALMTIRWSAMACTSQVALLAGERGRASTTSLT
jgi:hypothetical protein